MNALLQDLRYALRMLAKSPGFTAIAVLSLALGIGVTTAVFSVLDVLLLRPLPVPEPDRLISLYHQNVKNDGLSSTSYPNYEYYRDHNPVFNGLAAFLRVPTSMHSGDSLERVPVALVSPNYFEVLGIRPIIGRPFTESDTAPVVVLSHDLWQQRFGGAQDIVGRVVTLHSTPFAVIGVAPKGFRGVVHDWGGPPAMWIPFSQRRAAVPALTTRKDYLAFRGADNFLVTGRLKNGVGIEQAQASMASLRASLVAEHASVDRSYEITLLPTAQARMWPGRRASVKTFLGLLAGIVSVVLLIACANVANLLLTRAARRQSEVAVRLALGASRLRLGRQLLTESVLLAALGGAAGLIVARWTMALLESFQQPFRMPLSFEIGLDGRVLAFALGVSILTGLLFGLAPLRQAGGLDLVTALKIPGGGARRRGLRLDNALIVAQVALSLVLLTGAGLFLRTLANARAVDITQDPESVLMANLALATHGYDDSESRRFYPRLLDRVRSVPGVVSAGMVMIVPLGGRRGGTNISVDDPNEQIQVHWNVVSPDYFRTIGIPLLRGRDFTSSDNENAPRVVVVNQRMAERFWPGENPVGRQIRLTRPPELAQVVGVVSDGPTRGVREDVRAGFYQSLYQAMPHSMTLQVRVLGNAAQTLAAIRREVSTIDRNLPLADVRTMRAHQDVAVSGERLLSTLLAIFGTLAVTLAAIGIYGVTSFAVARRTREIGIRMALGARTGSVVRMVLRRGLVLTLVGSALGIALAIAGSRLVESFLFGVSPTDPVTLVVVPLVLIAVALAAALIPARRASRVDPVSALRYE